MDDQRQQQTDRKDAEHHHLGERSSHHQVQLVAPEVVRHDLKHKDHRSEKVVEVERVLYDVVLG